LGYRGVHAVLSDTVLRREKMHKMCPFGSNYDVHTVYNKTTPNKFLVSISFTSKICAGRPYYALNISLDLATV